mmetsp:Transcript_13541/g.19372  ORF Transcript_13541/g.19372 Transcript_13541/m.19372 type:complete len:743 (+) Transcript_13541:190-2418(+)
MFQRHHTNAITASINVCIGAMIFSAGFASLTTLLAVKRFKPTSKKDEREDGDNKLDDNSISQKELGDNEWTDDSNVTSEKDNLGPIQSPETRFQLNLRGRIDQIYQREGGGPKPFEFNSEVVDVFDDMVSRSVPLYCEVIDLAIYWVQKYHLSGTNMYDLGCSTGTTIDVLARYFANLNRERKFGTNDGNDAHHCHFVGIDTSNAMVQACKHKLEWTQKYKPSITVDIQCSDMLTHPIHNASFVIMNYTLQFVPPAKRVGLLQKINNGLVDGGVLLLSEKVRAESAEIQETCTWIYEDFKERRNYTRREIARKKEALMNVLVPYTESELKTTLQIAGFQEIEIAAKWNNFTTIFARKSTHKDSVPINGNNQKNKHKTKNILSPSSSISSSLLPIHTSPRSNTRTLNLDALFDSTPTYMYEYLEQNNLHSFCKMRQEAFDQKGGLSSKVLSVYDEIAALILSLPQMKSKTLQFNTPHLTIGNRDELTSKQAIAWDHCATKLRPWKKGPLKIFDTTIDTEWRSDWKWERLQKSLPNLDDKVICDLGCGNGYYMFRMLEYNPRFVLGIDPNLHAFLEFQVFSRFSSIPNLKFEYLRADCLTILPNVFDVVFCLGLLYHTPDPMGMLKDIKKSMKNGSTLVVDCQGIPGEDDIALFPKRRYANMKGVYFLPTLNALKNWLKRSNFVDIEVIFSEILSVDEQRITEWAPMHKSLKESLDVNDPNKTMEGYPAPHRFYLKARKQGPLV